MAAVITLVDARQLRVDVVVDETDVGKISAGQSVNVSFEALAGQRFPATVKVVAPTATVQSGVVSYAIQVQLAQGAVMVRPGMTGLWQVSGRNDVDYDARVYLDSWYVKNWSLWHDMVILLKTVRVVLARSGAY